MKIDLTHWSIMRIIKLVIAIGCFYTYYQSREWFVLAIGIFVFIQVLFNTACPDGACEIPHQKDIK